MKAFLVVTPATGSPVSYNPQKLKFSEGCPGMEGGDVGALLVDWLIGYFFSL